MYKQGKAPFGVVQESVDVPLLATITSTTTCSETKTITSQKGGYPSTYFNVDAVEEARDHHVQS